ncbi:hypothetical protein LBMAG03_09340 [Actinomycetes bacterium]|nr:hypothetical protein LBMAG03_09340 [Actinomycetes bacterium]
MSVSRRAPRMAGRFIGGAVIARGVKRYPIVGVMLVGIRLWRRRQRRVDRMKVRLRDNESVSIRHRRDW